MHLCSLMSGESWMRKVKAWIDCPSKSQWMFFLLFLAPSLPLAVANTFFHYRWNEMLQGHQVTLDLSLVVAPMLEMLPSNFWASARDKILSWGRMSERAKLNWTENLVSLAGFYFFSFSFWFFLSPSVSLNFSTGHELREEREKRKEKNRKVEKKQKAPYQRGEKEGEKEKKRKKTSEKASF